MPPKPAQALHEAASTDAVVIPLFPAEPVVTQKSEPPAYLRFASVGSNAYMNWQHEQQRAQLDANIAAQKGQTPQVRQQSYDQTLQHMTCPWSIAGRKPDSP